MGFFFLKGLTSNLMGRDHKAGGTEVLSKKWGFQNVKKFNFLRKEE